MLNEKKYKNKNKTKKSEKQYWKLRELTQAAEFRDSNSTENELIL